MSNTYVILRLHLVSATPSEFTALQQYSPSSSGYTSLMVKVAVEFLYLRSTTSDEERGEPFLNQVTCGSGTPLTKDLRNKHSPSLRDVSASSVVNLGVHISESSGTKQTLCKFLSLTFFHFSVVP